MGGEGEGRGGEGSGGGLKIENRTSGLIPVLLNCLLFLPLSPLSFKRPQPRELVG